MIDQASKKRSDVSAVPYLHQRERTLPARLLEDLPPGSVARAFVWVDTSARCAPEALAVVCAVAKEQNSVLLVYQQNPNGQTYDRAGGRVARQSEGTTRPPVARDQARPSTSAKR